MKMMGEWPEEYCEGKCLRSRFPIWVWGLWEFLGVVIQPVSIGMAGVTFDIDQIKFDRWIRMVEGLTPDEELEIFEILKYMLSLMELNKNDCVFEEKDVKLIKLVDEQDDIETELKNYYGNQEVGNPD